MTIRSWVEPKRAVKTTERRLRPLLVESCHSLHQVASLVMLQPFIRPNRSYRLTLGRLEELAADKENDRIGNEEPMVSGETTSNAQLDCLASNRHKL